MQITKSIGNQLSPCKNRFPVTQIAQALTVQCQHSLTSIDNSRQRICYIRSNSKHIHTLKYSTRCETLSYVQSRQLSPLTPIIQNLSLVFCLWNNTIFNTSTFTITAFLLHS